MTGDQWAQVFAATFMIATLLLFAYLDWRDR